jgi:putative FmdB family regulatory protein
MSVPPKTPAAVVNRRSARSAVRVSLDRLTARHEITSAAATSLSAQHRQRAPVLPDRKSRRSIGHLRRPFLNAASSAAARTGGVFIMGEQVLCDAPMAVIYVSGRCALPTYAFRCAQCGGFDLVRPMAEAGATAVCPSCGEAARRVFVAPALRALDTGLRQALAAGEQSADSPQVVTSVPGRSRPTARTTDPRHHRLPRP